MAVIYRITASMIEEMREDSFQEVMGEGWYLCGTLLLIPSAVFDTVLLPIYLLYWIITKTIHTNIKSLYKGGDQHH